MHRSANDLLCAPFSESGEDLFRRLAESALNAKFAKIFGFAQGILRFDGYRKVEGRKIYAGYYHRTAGSLRFLERPQNYAPERSAAHPREDAGRDAGGRTARFDEPCE